MILRGLFPRGYFAAGFILCASGLNAAPITLQINSHAAQAEIESASTSAIDISAGHQVTVVRAGGQHDNLYSGDSVMETLILSPWPLLRQAPSSDEANLEPAVSTPIESDAPVPTAAFENDTDCRMNGCGSYTDVTGPFDSASANADVPTAWLLGSSLIDLAVVARW